MPASLLVGLGGALGALLRWAAAWVPPPLFGPFPIVTFAINMAGSALIGLVMRLSPRYRLFLGTGVLGGFTTFSGFAAEVMALPGWTAALYAVLSLGLGPLLALAIGNSRR